MQPIRVQRKRTKGWKMPENTVSVCRPGKWGNPYKIVEIEKSFFVKSGENLFAMNPEFGDSIELARKLAIHIFKIYLQDKIDIGALQLEELRGKNLACFCKIGEPCHADILLELANK